MPKVRGSCRIFTTLKPYLTGAVFRAPVGVRVEEYECIENNPDPLHMRKAAELEKQNK